MIITLSTELRGKVQEYYLLRQIAGQADTIATVSAQITALDQKLTDWATGFNACQKYLVDDESRSLRSTATRLQRQLMESSNAFDRGNYQQAGAISTANDGAQKLYDATQHGWSTYAQGKLSPILPLLDLAAQLPGLQDAAARLRIEWDALRTLATKLPKSSAEVTRFHERLAALDDKVRAGSSLNDEQRSFLNRLRLGAATLNDLSPELLEWCKQNGLARSLKITR